jgi:DNA (cytosine-5)-methyltransferase 1
VSVDFRHQTISETTNTLQAGNGGQGYDLNKLPGVITAINWREDDVSLKGESPTLGTRDDIAVCCVLGDCTHALTAEGADASEDGTGRGTPIIAFQERGRKGGRSLEWQEDVAYALTSPTGGGRAQERLIATPKLVVRRLTPRECERLQGFPDDHTLIPVKRAKRRTKTGKFVEIGGELWRLAADGPRYRAIGNSMAVPVMREIGDCLVAEHWRSVE